MADAIRQIRHDLERLAKANDALAKEFDLAYRNYLQTLSVSMQKQVILACYHLCTHTYPTQFLKLSFRQREKLQQSFQKYIYQVQQQLENSYVLATMPLENDEDEREEEKLLKMRRSLPIADRSPRRRRNESDDDVPSIEFIAIGDMDEDDAIAIAKDPLLASALSEFADSLALDEEAIVKRVKQELLRKAAQAAAKSDPENDDDDSSDDNASDSDSGHSDSGDSDSSVVFDHPTGQVNKGANDNHTKLSAMDDEDIGRQSSCELLPSASNLDTSQSSQPFTEDNGATLRPPDDEKGDDGSATTVALDDTKAEVPLEDVSGKTFSSCQTALTPRELAVRQEQLEKNLVLLLRNLSKKINQSFHQSEILPQKLPLAVLNAALSSDIAADAVGGPPNVLNLLVEAEGKSRDSKVMRVTAIRLRPPELEFSDSQLSACRSRIRELMVKLQKIGKEYDKKQRERAIAEAESAWRSSWYEHRDNA